MFSHSGYSHHISKTQRAVCRAVHAPFLFRTGPATASEPQAGSGLPGAPFTATLAAIRGPADHGAREIDRDSGSTVPGPDSADHCDPLFDAPTQGWVDGMCPFQAFRCHENISH
jgi:hypothetical protein